MNAEYKVNISLKSILKFEKLLGIPFGSIDLNNEEHLICFMYCIGTSNNDSGHTLDEFKGIQEKPLIFKKLAKSFKHKEQSISEFQTFIKTKSMGKPEFVQNVATSLVLKGHLDADYLLNQMDLDLIIMFYNAMESS